MTLKSLSLYQYIYKKGGTIMKVEQIYNIVNTLSQEYLGTTEVLNEDLSNIVDIGSKIINLDNLDKYVRSLIDQIGRIVFVNRPYHGGAPNILMEGWEYGAIEEKITYDYLPEAEENDTWELEDQKSYDPNIFYKPAVSAKFFSSKTTYDIPMSLAERQIMSAFQNGTQVNSFFSMIETAIYSSLTVKNDSLAQRAVNNMIARTLQDGGATRAINLLTLYNDQFDQELEAEGCIYDKDFVRFSSYMIRLIISRMQRMSTLFNMGGRDRFTPVDAMHLQMLSEFEMAAETYLYSDTFHENYVKLPPVESVPYWQGSGTNYDFSSTSKINVTTKNDAGTSFTKVQSGILGVAFDRESCAIVNRNFRVTANYNGKAEFLNNWYKCDAGYFNDGNENFVVFYVAD